MARRRYPEAERPLRESKIAYVIQRNGSFTRRQLEKMPDQHLDQVFRSIPPSDDIRSVTEVEYDPMVGQDSSLYPHRRRSPSSHR